MARPGRPARRRARPLRIEASVPPLEGRLGPIVDLVPDLILPPGDHLEGHRVGILRPSDLVALDVVGVRMALRSTRAGPRLVTDGDDARLVVRFPFQHIGEEAWLEDEVVPPPTLARALTAHRSRLVYAVPDGAEIDYSIEGLLDAMRRLPLVVVPAAQPAPAGRPALGGVIGGILLPGGLVLGRSGATIAVGRAPARLRRAGERVDAARTPAARLSVHTTALRIARLRLAATSGVVVGAELRPEAVRTGDGPPRIIGGPGDLIDRFEPVRPRPRRLRPPGPDETAIEAPWRLIVSPSANAGFAHATSPVSAPPADEPAPEPPGTAPIEVDLVEQWHTRMGVRHVGEDRGEERDVHVDERTNPQRIVRAVWNRDRDLGGATEPDDHDFVDPQPFRMSLDELDRWILVRQSTGTAPAPDEMKDPAPVDVTDLMLSPLGAWLDLHGKWETADQIPTTPTRKAIDSWDHIAPMGRDQFVKVVYPGYGYSPGHEMVLVKQTEREIKEAADPVARLYQRFYMVVTEPVRYYDNDDFPFTSVRISPLVTPDLEPPAGDTFFPTVLGGPVFQFTLIATDHDENVHRFTTPLLWVSADLVNTETPDGAAIETAYRGGGITAFRLAAHGQSIAYAPSTRPGDTVLETARIELTGTVAPRVITPHLLTADVVAPAARHLTPQPATFTVRYPDAYSGFPTGGGGAGNAGEVFAEVVDAAKVGANLDAALKGLALPNATVAPLVLPEVGFGSTENAGGFIDPAQQIAGISRRQGTVGDVAGAVAGGFSPADFLGQALPKLFGLFSLVDILETVGVDLDDAPEFITETLGAVQGLVDDLVALRDAVEQAHAAAQDPAALWPAAQIAELEAIADQLTALVPAAISAFETLVSPEGFPDPAAVEAQITALLAPFTAQLGALEALLAAAPRLSPVIDAKVRRFIAAVRPYLADAAAVAETVTQVLGFLQGLDPANVEVRVHLEWRPKLTPWRLGGVDVFSPQPDSLTLSVEARASGKGDVGVDVLAELADFDLELLPPEALMRLHFDRLAFRGGSSHNPEVDVVFGGIEFVGPLAFVETLRELIPLDGFSDPPFLDVSPSGVRAGFDLALPDTAVGVFAITNISFGADCHVPFLGDIVTVGFNFASRERPFGITVAFLGGGGFFGIRLSPRRLEVLELALEFGARLAVNLGVASGSVEAMGGVYLRLEGDTGSLTGYFRIRGEVDVLGLISASIELSMELTYEFDTGKMVGRASLTVEVEVFLFSASVTISVERRFAGSNGDPTFAEVMAVEADGTSDRWDDYCLAFAGEH